MAGASQPVLVLGFHRSGTSFLASLLQKLGVHLGEVLLPGNAGNRHGHFENVSFLDFQRALVQRHRLPGRYLYDADIFCESPLHFKPSEAEREQARELIAQAERPGCWGWKDPRTCLFLDLWRELLPEARFVIVYRHPLDVYRSFLRRQDWDMLFYPAVVFHSYEAYYAPVRRLLSEAPERCQVLHAPTAFRDLPALAAQLSAYLGLAAPAPDTHWEFFTQELADNQTAAAQHALFSYLISDAAETFDALQAHCPQPGVWPEPPVDPAKAAQARQLKDRFGIELASHPLHAREAYLPLIERFCLNEPFEALQADRQRLIFGLQEARAKETRLLAEQGERLRDYAAKFEAYYAEYQRYYAAYQAATREAGHP